MLYTIQSGCPAAVKKKNAYYTEPLKDEIVGNFCWA